MPIPSGHIHRRDLLIRGAAALGAFGAGAPARAAAPTLTPGQSEGPFYPTEFPVDTDHDLVRVTGRAAEAIGQVTHVTGRVLDRHGQPVRGAAVEIWQCDARGIYRHPRAPNRSSFDDAFQGYGRTLVGSDGSYRFRTIRPVPYTGRTPHIHFAVRVPHVGLRFVTQMYVEGEPRNARDGLLMSLADPLARQSLTVALRPSGIEPGSLQGNFDIVLGV
jgi:protocatechuate 3,4-dioxygenase beta subunit